eukprot:tig00000829_g4674.t1
MAALPVVGQIPPIFKAELVPLDYGAIRLGSLGNAPYQRAWPARSVPRMPKKIGKGVVAAVKSSLPPAVGASVAPGAAPASAAPAAASSGSASSTWRPKIYGNSPFLVFNGIKPGQLPAGGPKPYKP